ncbi:hypothetical protein GCM10028818_56710 [Spirosoma horti]
MKQTSLLQEVEDIISQIWLTIDQWMNTGDKLISSEKSVVFNFAWLLQKTCQDRIELIDFETNLFHDFSDGQFLDLFILYRRGDQSIRVGIEFKYPNEKKSKSGQTQVRAKIVNDLKRLTWLVTNGGIDIGCFLCVTNEKNYVNQGKYKKNTDFLTHHGQTYAKGSFLPANDLYKEPVRAITDITFSWNHIQKTQKKYEIAGAVYSFLEPIFIRNNELELAATF